MKATFYTSGYSLSQWLPASFLQAANVGLSRLAAFVLMLLVFYYASVLFWQVQYPQDFKAPVALDLPEQPEVSRQGSWNWFRNTAPSARPAVRSKLHAQLLGVIAQGGEGEGVALIALKGEKGKVFNVGDEVSPAVFLHRVGAYYVHLERDGEIEILEIKRVNLFSGKAVEREADASSADIDEPVSVMNLRETLIKDPAKLTDIMRFRHVKTAQGRGFKISPKGKQHQQLFDEIGFKQGDIIISVNDLAVQNLIKNPKSWQSLLESDGISLKVMRSGAEMDIFVQ